MFASVKKTIAFITLSLFAVSVFAANPNQGPKPKCPPGKLPVYENGIWKCKEPSIKAPTKPQMSTTSSAKQFDASPKKPPRAKPDLTIYSIERPVGQYANDPKRLTVHVKNSGNAKSIGGKVKVTLSNGQTATANMPTINPNSMRLVYVVFSKNIPSKVRATATADSQKQIAESNESNNTSKPVSL